MRRRPRQKYKDESTMFRMVMDNFKSSKIYRGAGSGKVNISTRSTGEQEREPVVVSDLPSSWRRQRVKMGTEERVEIVTSKGLRITSQAALDIYTRLQKMPNLRLDWQDMLVFSKGTRFEPDDPVVLEIVSDRQEKERNACRNFTKTSQACQMKDINEYRMNLSKTKGVPAINLAVSDSVESVDEDCIIIEHHSTETILEKINEQHEEDDECVIVKHTNSEMILEAVKDDVNNCDILESVQDDDASSCNILEAVARSNRDAGSRDSVFTLISSSDDFRSSSDSRVSSSSSIKSGYSSNSRGSASERIDLLEAVKDDVNNCDILEAVGRSSLSKEKSFSSRESQSSPREISRVVETSAKSGDISASAEKKISPLQDISKSANKLSIPRKEASETSDDLPANWRRRVHKRATGKQDWSIVTECGRVIRSQKQLDILTKRWRMQPLKLKGRDVETVEKKVLLPEDSASEKYQEEGELQCLERVEDGQKGAELEEEKKGAEVSRLHLLKKAIVSFVSDDGLEVAKDSSVNLRSLRRRRGALLMEERLVSRKDKLKFIEEAMSWLKPPLTKENYGLGSRREIEKDSEATPIKAFPAWAESDQVDAAMEEQEYLDPNLIFAKCPSPDLREVFGSSYKEDGGGWGGRSPVKGTESE